jgi:MFS family permease
MSFTSRWSDVYVAAGARAVTTCGDFLAATTLALALQQAGAGGAAVSGLFLAASLPLVVLAPLTGRIVDRADSRLLLVGTGIAQAVICLGLAFVERPALIIALVGLLSCGLAITQPTLAALLPAMVRRADLAKASSVNQTAGAIGMLLAPALAGVLAGQFGTRLPLLLDAASYLSLVVAGLVLRTRRGTGPAAAGEPVAWRLRGDRMLSVMVAAVAAVIVGVGAINVIEVFFIRDTLNASTTVFGLVSGSWTAGSLIGGVLFARRAHSAGWLIGGVLLALAGACLMVLAGAAVWNALLLIPLWLIGGAFNGALNLFANLLMIRRVPAEARGRGFAVFGAGIQGAGMFGLLLGGLLVDRFEPRLLVAAAGAAGLVAVLCCVPVVRRAVRREQHPGIRPGESCGPEIASVHERQPSASPGRPHPVPELPADLLGSDALGSVARR